MASPSFMILTEPAKCELVGDQLLLQAVLQMQQLSKEGVPVSQAFCDNPASAAEFIDAYAKVYPELQLQSPGLPPPEQLFSMIMSGRLTPRLGINLTPDATKLDDAAALHPLVVLSLGKPNAIMQALQGHRSVKNSINVIEIPQETEGHSVAVSVAVAVAAHGMANTSSSAETTSPGSAQREGDDFRGSEDGAGAPLKLESAELNLNYLHDDANKEPAHPSVGATGVVDVTPVSPAGDAGPALPAHADASAADSGSGTSQVSQPEPPAPTTAPALTAAPVLEQTAASAPVLTVVSEGVNQPPDGGTDASDGNPPDAAQQSAEPGEKVADSGESAANPNAPPDRALSSNGPGENVAASDGSAADRSTTESGEAAPDDTPSDGAQPSHEPEENVVGSNGSSAERNSTGPDGEDVGDARSSFDGPGEDVIYAPAATLTSEDDTSYPLPEAAAAEDDSLGNVFHMSMAGEIVDLEVISASDAADGPVACEPIDPILMRPPVADGQGGHDFSSPQLQSADVGHLDLPAPDRDTHEDQPATPVHDLDI
jgi:hypothetical protein